MKQFFGRTWYLRGAAEGLCGNTLVTATVGCALPVAPAAQLLTSKYSDGWDARSSIGQPLGCDAGSPSGSCTLFPSEH